jgi:hypothetical protein
MILLKNAFFYHGVFTFFAVIGDFLAGGIDLPQNAITFINMECITN